MYQVLVIINHLIKQLKGKLNQVGPTEKKSEIRDLMAMDQDQEAMTFLHLFRRDLSLQLVSSHTLIHSRWRQIQVQAIINLKKHQRELCTQWMLVMTGELISASKTLLPVNMKIATICITVLFQEVRWEEIEESSNFWRHQLTINQTHPVTIYTDLQETVQLLSIVLDHLPVKLITLLGRIAATQDQTTTIEVPLWARAFPSTRCLIAAKITDPSKAEMLQVLANTIQPTLMLKIRLNRLVFLRASVMVK